MGFYPGVEKKLRDKTLNWETDDIRAALMCGDRKISVQRLQGRSYSLDETRIFCDDVTFFEVEDGLYVDRVLVYAFAHPRGRTPILDIRDDPENPPGVGIPLIGNDGDVHLRWSKRGLASLARIEV